VLIQGGTVLFGDGPDAFAKDGIRQHKTDAAMGLFGPHDLRVNLYPFILLHFKIQLDQELGIEALAGFQAQTAFADIAGFYFDGIFLDLIDVAGFRREDGIDLHGFLEIKTVETAFFGTVVHARAMPRGFTILNLKFIVGVEWQVFILFLFFSGRDKNSLRLFFCRVTFREKEKRRGGFT
jgi:hypothetical protein